MWALQNHTAYSAERNWTRDKNGVHWWIVAVQATFDIAEDGGLSLAKAQPSPVLAPEYFGEAGKSSVRVGSDLQQPKPGTDILVIGSAYAPHGKPAATVPVVLHIADQQKKLLVHGERVYFEGPTGLQTSAPQPFTTRPIRYEQAFGGSDYSDADPQNHRIDERNPIGRGFARHNSVLQNMPAHCIEYASGDPAKTGPAGFGPTDSAWLPRRNWAGTYDQHWEQTKKPLLPDDYEPAFAMSAPADQQMSPPLVGGDRIGLVNMTPGGSLVFDIPHIKLGFESSFRKRRESHPSHLTTVLVESDEQRLSLVWQSCLRVAAPEVDYLDATVITEEANGPE